MARLLDLPGLYSLTPHSPDEVIAREVLMGLRSDTPAPDVIVNVVDASNLERNLYLTSQLLDLGLPVVIGLTMMDSLSKEGVTVYPDVLAKEIGVPIFPIIASRREGLPDLLSGLRTTGSNTAPAPAWKVPEAVAKDLAILQEALTQEQGLSTRLAFAESISLLMLLLGT